MSLPITICLIQRAARNEGAARKDLEERCAINRKHGAFSIYPCRHTPPCEKPSEEQMCELVEACPQFTALILTTHTDADARPSDS